MKKSRLLCAICACAFSFTAHASTYDEIGDTGQLTSTAQSVPGGTTAISGSLSNDADMYGFFWGGGAFQADTFGSGPDTQLFLFNSVGAGVWANDDASTNSLQSLISDNSLAAGSYFIAVSSWNYDPRDGSDNPLFPDISFVGQYAPLSSEVLASWSGASGSSDEYTIVISSTSPIPVPAAVWLFGSGLLGLIGIARRKKAA
jgi:hypothetical protein